MKQIKEKILNPATLIALLALFVALGGTSYAISQLPKNSVGTSQIKNNAVTSAKIKNRSLLARDFRGGQIPAPTSSFALSDSPDQRIIWPNENQVNTKVPITKIRLPRTGLLTGTFTGEIANWGAAGSSAVLKCQAVINNWQSSMPLTTSSLEPGLSSSVERQLIVPFSFTVRKKDVGTGKFSLHCSKLKSFERGKPDLRVVTYELNAVLTSP